MGDVMKTKVVYNYHWSANVILVINFADQAVEEIIDAGDSADDLYSNIARLMVEYNADMEFGSPCANFDAQWYGDSWNIEYRYSGNDPNIIPAYARSTVKTRDAIVKFFKFLDVL